MPETFAKSSLSEATHRALVDFSDKFCPSEVTITKTGGWSTTVRCDRPVDHTGRHRTTASEMIVAWSQ